MDRISSLGDLCQRGISQLSAALQPLRVISTFTGLLRKASSGLDCRWQSRQTEADPRAPRAENTPAKTPRGDNLSPQSALTATTLVFAYVTAACLSFPTAAAPSRAIGFHSLTEWTPHRH